VAALSAELTARLALLVLSVGLTGSAHAQRMYKYQDANGVWVYSDRQPEGNQEFHEEALQRTVDTPEVRVSEQQTADGLRLIAENSYFCSGTDNRQSRRRNHAYAVRIPVPIHTGKS